MYFCFFLGRIKGGPNLVVIVIAMAAAMPTARHVRDLREDWTGNAAELIKFAAHGQVYVEQCFCDLGIAQSVVQVIVAYMLDKDCSLWLREREWSTVLHFTIQADSVTRAYQVSDACIIVQTQKKKPCHTDAKEEVQVWNFATLQVATYSPARLELQDNRVTVIFAETETETEREPQSRSYHVSSFGTLYPTLPKAKTQSSTIITRSLFDGYSLHWSEGSLTLQRETETETETETKTHTDNTRSTHNTCDPEKTVTYSKSVPCRKCPEKWMSRTIAGFIIVLHAFDTILLYNLVTLEWQIVAPSQQAPINPINPINPNNPNNPNNPYNSNHTPTNIPTTSAEIFDLRVDNERWLFGRTSWSQAFVYDLQRGTYWLQTCGVLHQQRIDQRLIQYYFDGTCKAFNFLEPVPAPVPVPSAIAPWRTSASTSTSDAITFAHVGVHDPTCISILTEAGTWQLWEYDPSSVPSPISTTHAKFKEFKVASSHSRCLSLQLSIRRIAFIDADVPTLTIVT